MVCDAKIKRILKLLDKCTNNDPSRLSLNGIFIEEIDGERRLLTATNGHIIVSVVASAAFLGTELQIAGGMTVNSVWFSSKAIVACGGTVPKAEDVKPGVAKLSDEISRDWMRRYQVDAAARR